jgi:hypothetical protein
MRKLLTVLFVLPLGIFVAACRQSASTQAQQPPAVSGPDPAPVFKVPPMPPDTKARPVEPKWVEWKARDGRQFANLYDDIVGHNRQGFKEYGSRNSTAHETNHLVEADIRNHYYSIWYKTNPKTNPVGFYVGRDRALALENPKFRMQHVAEAIPAKLRFGRYNLYMIQQRTQFEAQPLYIWNEWNCYVNGFGVDVADAEAGRTRQETDDVNSVTEFTMYAMYVGMVCEQLDPEYFKANPDFKAFLVWNSVRGQDYVRRSKNYKHLQWSYKDLGPVFKESPEAEPIRGFMEKSLDMDLKDFFRD